jgi:hypothetical protein
MVLGKLEAVYSMLLFEQRAFLLDNRAKVVFFEYISDCLGTDRVGDDVVDEMGSLNSIVNLPSGDLTHDGLLVPIRKLGRTTSLAIFLVWIEFLLDPANGGLPYMGFEFNLTCRIAFMKKRNDGSALSRRCGTHVVVWRKEGGWGNFSASNVYKQSHMTLFITFGLDLIVIQTDTKAILVK